MKDRTFEIKNDGDTFPEDVQMLTGKILIIFGHLVMFAEQRNLQVTITNIVNSYPQSVSNTHKTGRAIDISVTDWKQRDIEDCIIYLNKEVKHLGAISMSDKVRRPVIYHRVKGGQYHFHLQSSY